MANFMQYTPKHACIHRRNIDTIKETFDIKSSGNDADTWNDSNVLKDALIEYLKGNLKLPAIADAVEASIAGTYDIEEQEKLKIKHITDLAIRACRSEGYRKDRITFPERTVVVSGEEEVDVWCSAAYVDKTRKYVDCVIYMASAPKFTKSGKNKIENYLPVYWLELMARQIADNEFNKGEAITTEAHFVYLKKAFESKGVSIRYDYLDEKNNLGISNNYIVGSDAETDIDKKRNELIDEFATGKECTPEDCANCPNNIICHFSLPPEAAPKKELKVRKKIVPSEAQQKIIDWAQEVAAN